MRVQPYEIIIPASSLGRVFQGLNGSDGPGLYTVQDRPRFLGADSRFCGLFRRRARRAILMVAKNLMA